MLFRYKNIIENKKTNGTSTESKNKAWLNIVDEFNSSNISSSETRNCKQLKQLYKNIKFCARKDAANNNRKKYEEFLAAQEVSPEKYQIEELKQQATSDKHKVKETGGGSDDESALDETGAQILALFGDQLTPLQNIFDDDAGYHGK